MISWALEHWRAVLGWGGGLGLVLAIAAFMLAPAAVLRFVGEVFGWVLDKGRQGVAWLRKPGSGRKAITGLVFFGLATWAATASLSSWRKNDQIVVVTQERDAAKQAKEVALAGIKAERATWQEQQAKFADAQRRVTAAMERAEAASAAAQVAATEARKAAGRRYGAWLRVYEGREDICKAAEEALDVACKSVGRL